MVVRERGRGVAAFSPSKLIALDAVGSDVILLMPKLIDSVP